MNSMRSGQKHLLVTGTALFAALLINAATSLNALGVKQEKVFYDHFIDKSRTLELRLSAFEEGDGISALLLSVRNLSDEDVYVILGSGCLRLVHGRDDDTSFGRPEFGNAAEKTAFYRDLGARILHGFIVPAKGDVIVVLPMYSYLFSHEKLEKGDVPLGTLGLSFDSETLSFTNKAFRKFTMFEPENFKKVYSCIMVESSRYELHLKDGAKLRTELKVKPVGFSEDAAQALKKKLVERLSLSNEDRLLFDATRH